MEKARILGAILGAMLAMSAVGAVSASGDTLTAQGYPAVLTGTSETGFTDEVVTTAGTKKCPDVKYDATITGNVTTAGSISVTPTYPDVGCTAFGFPGTIDANGCTLLFRVLVGTAGTVSLVCPAGKELTMTGNSSGTIKCTMHWPPQNDIPGTVKFTNVGGGESTVEANLKEISYTHTQGTGIGACAGGKGSNATLVMKAIFSAESESGTPIALILS